MKLPKIPKRTTPGFAFPMVDRALSECLSHRQFGPKEIKRALEFFGQNPPECVFCGSKDVKRWDHLVPIKKGGETVLGNMALTCATCDDSKRDLSYEEWMTGDSKNSPKSIGIKDIDQRVKRIRAYMQNFNYTPQNLEERLTRQELRRWKEINTRLKELRKDISRLISDYKARRS